MINKSLAVSKSPAVTFMLIVIVALFAGALAYGETAIAMGEAIPDRNERVTSTWSVLSGLYFGLVLPIVVGSIVALLMGPEFQRHNARWLLSQPGGVRYLMKEKLRVLAMVSATVTGIHLAFVAGFGILRGYVGVAVFPELLLGCLTATAGVFSVGCLYMLVSTLTKNVAGTVSVAVTLSVASLAAAIVGTIATQSTAIELVLPTAQIIATSGSRYIGEEGLPASLPLALAMSLLFAVMSIALTTWRLRKVATQ